MILSKSAELFFYNPNKSIVTGPVTASENILSNNRTWSTNNFPGDTILIELRLAKEDVSNTNLHISKVLIGREKKNIQNLSDSASFGNFGYSSLCNRNVSCPEGASWNSERTGVCLITTETGFASGALISNVCSTNVPYVLTAWHVTQAGNPNNWTYIFGWWSSTCEPNSYNQQALMFNGATVRSTYEPTDFSLLELFQVPQPSSNLSYLGWSRSSVAPSSSVGIHHPMGDQMKISLANSSASIGNIRTNSNTAWRVLWNLGSTQNGSSGSPLFDPNNRVVGQLFSSTQPEQPPCNQLTGGMNYGRFDISWTGGGTNVTRLSNWLDPNNTGATTTNTTSVANLNNPVIGKMSLIGDAEICSGSKTYYLTGAPAGVPIQWTSSNNAIAQVVGNGTSATVTKFGFGNVTITATVGGNCYTNNTRSILINVGGPYAGFNIVDYIQSGSCYQAEAFYFFKANLAFGSGQTSYQWGYRLQGSPNQTIISGTSQTENFIFPTSGTYEVFVRGVNACGIGTPESVKAITVVDSCGSGGFRMTASPNPTSDQLNVTIDNETENSKAPTTFENTTIELYNFNTGLKQKEWKFSNNEKMFKLSVKGLAKGLYVLRVTKGAFNQSRQISIE